MTPPPNRPASGRRRRTTVEVYFLLYLSSIILLLGTTAGPGGQDDLHATVLELLAPGFRVEAEKPALLWRFFPAGITPDSMLATPLEQDSTNIITAFGTVADLRFAIVEIADTISGRSLPVEMATLTRIGDRSAVFGWRPASEELLENRVYRVTVSATARPIPPRDLRPETRRQVMEILERGGTVADSVTFTVNLLSVDRRGNGLVVETPTLRRPEEEAVPAQPDTVIIREPAVVPALPAFGIRAPDVVVSSGSDWTNSIELIGQPGSPIVWSFSSNATAAVRSQLNLRLRGKSPRSGSEEVQVTATRPADGMTATAEFTVSPAPVNDIDVTIPQKLYVGEEYTLDFRDSASNDIPLRVVVNDGREILSYDRPAEIPFVPKAVGEVAFIRSDASGDKKYTRTVQKRPLPDAPLLVRRSNDEVIIRTVSYGRVNSGPNRTRLVIQSGNAREPVEIRERRSNDELNKKYTQEWRVARKDAGDFHFSAYALDQYGSSGGKSPVVDFRP